MGVTSNTRYLRGGQTGLSQSATASTVKDKKGKAGWGQKLREKGKKEQGRGDNLLGAKRELIKESVSHSSQKNATFRCDRKSKASALRPEDLWADNHVAH